MVCSEQHEQHPCGPILQRASHGTAVYWDLGRPNTSINMYHTGSLCPPSLYTCHHFCHVHRPCVHINSQRTAVALATSWCARSQALQCTHCQLAGNPIQAAEAAAIRNETDTPSSLHATHTKCTAQRLTTLTKETPVRPQHMARRLPCAIRVHSCPDTRPRHAATPATLHQPPVITASYYLPHAAHPTPYHLPHALPLTQSQPHILRGPTRRPSRAKPTFSTPPLPTLSSLTPQNHTRFRGFSQRKLSNQPVPSPPLKHPCLLSCLDAFSFHYPAGLAGIPPFRNL